MSEIRAGGSRYGFRMRHAVQLQWDSYRPGWVRLKTTKGPIGVT